MAQCFHLLVEFLVFMLGLLACLSIFSHGDLQSSLFNIVIEKDKVYFHGEEVNAISCALLIDFGIVKNLNVAGSASASAPAPTSTSTSTSTSVPAPTSAPVPYAPPPGAFPGTFLAGTPWGGWSMVAPESC